MSLCDPKLTNQSIFFIELKQNTVQILLEEKTITFKSNTICKGKEDGGLEATHFKTYYIE